MVQVKMMSYNEAYGLRPVKLMQNPRRRKVVNLRHTVDKVLGSDLLYPAIALILALCIVVMLFSINSKLNRILYQ